MRIRAPVLMVLLVVGTVVVTWVFWRQVTFSRRLDDAALEAALADGASARSVQHGVHEIGLRFQEERPGMDRWAAALVAASRRDPANVRRTAAWAMGDAVERPEISARLREMVATDPDETSRRNAACALARCGDAAALPVLRAMLTSFTVTAPEAGTVETVLDAGRRAAIDAPVARLRTADGRLLDVPAPVPGAVVEVAAPAGAGCAAGAPLVVLGPDRDHAFNAAAALAIAGQAGDVELLRSLAAGRSGLPDDVALQAQRAASLLEARLRK